MTYQESLDWMFRQLPMYQQVGNKAYRIDLQNILKLAGHLQNPERNFKSIHVAGTNGKGSVSHMLASVFQESNYKTGLYTSPHLKDFRERVKINGEEISKKAVIDFIEHQKYFLESEQFSFFEMTVGMAFQIFAKEKVDIAIIEVGLGGRLDSTNIISPELSIVTNIGLDHTQFLGNTLAKIAREKAGIIKPGIPVIIGEKHPETLPIFKEIAAGKGSNLYLAQEYSGAPYTTDLRGEYQQKNILSVLKTVELMRENGWILPSAAVKTALKNVINNTGLHGRWEVLQNHPKVIADTAHNPDGLLVAMRQLQKETFQNLHLVFGVVNDKDLDAILPLLPQNAIYYFCRPNIPRGMDAMHLKQAAGRFGLRGKCFPSVVQALDVAIKAAQSLDVIYVGGSTFTVAEII